MQSWSSLVQLTLFAVAATFTPGPNALLLTSVAANYGLKSAVPAAVGVWAGIPTLIVVVGIGLAGAANAIAGARVVLGVAATLYLVWLAWIILRMNPPEAGQPGSSHPPSALKAAALQWVNPKVWTMCVGAMGAVAVSGMGSVTQALVSGAVFAVVLVPAVGMWTLFGSAVRRWLTSKRRFLIFKSTMGVLLLISAALTWIS